MNRNTLYVNNLNDKINKNDLKVSLYVLFSTYGTVVDIIALKTPKMRGQAHIVFYDASAAAIAMKALKNTQFFGKEMRIDYAKTQSKMVERIYGSEPRGSLKRSREDADVEIEDAGMLKRAS
ncbi:U2 snRNP-associated protein Msl1 [Schizosaccharomyces osmophilus]|uniref:U2 snRNP-associated protein Msl1 n=1 Tax=Schizosaccharomyces osmophilus TaxID=2545709 RepID=A0AAE9W6J9_9SCHI|nr:U2 snRNP-associated protein Msl1 [Schizosaccharomyces osmophilus]WBW70946.1 U2 snRNP-associated protein Msl1 [Schizosaccharomyces osmophilus]